MKSKLLLTILAIGVLLYLFIPFKKTATVTRSTNVNTAALFRKLSDTSTWKEWWPNNITKENRKVTRIMFNSFEVPIDKEHKTSSILQLVPITFDSTFVSWSTTVHGNRISMGKKHGELIKTIEQLLDSLVGYTKENSLYGFTVRQVLVTDSTLISMKKSFPHYPSVEDIQTMIDKLRRYIVSNHALPTNYPMLNLQKIGGNAYSAMVAVPVNKMLPETDLFLPKRVLTGGKLLETEIVGGPKTIELAFATFEQYVQDHQRIPPAIPYQLLVTDRQKEPDTSKWITRLYYPVF